MGGNAPKAVDRVLAYGDEWMPNVGRSGIEELAERIAELRERASAAGRDRIRVSGFGAPRDPETVERLREAGFDRLFWYVPPEPAEQVVPRVERCADRLSAVAAGECGSVLSATSTEAAGRQRASPRWPRTRTLWWPLATSHRCTADSRS